MFCFFDILIFCALKTYGFIFSYCYSDVFTAAFRQIHGDVDVDDPVSNDNSRYVNSEMSLFKILLELVCLLY